MSFLQLPNSEPFTLFPKDSKSATEACNDSPDLRDNTHEFPKLNTLPKLQGLDTWSFTNIFDGIIETNNDSSFKSEIFEEWKAQDNKATIASSNNTPTTAEPPNPELLEFMDHVRKQTSISASVDESSTASTIKARRNIVQAQQTRFRSYTSSTSQSKESEIFSSESRSSSISTDISSYESSAKVSDNEKPKSRTKLKWLLGEEALKPKSHSKVQEKSNEDSRGRDKPLPLPPTEASEVSKQPKQETPKLRSSAGAKSKSLPSRHIQIESTDEEDIDNKRKTFLGAVENANGRTSRMSIISTTARSTIAKLHVSALFDHTQVDKRIAGHAICQSENIAFGILRKANSLADLQSIATINKLFYKTYRQHEVTLVSKALSRTSLAAWELRQSVEHSVKPSPFKMKSVQRDLATVRALESFMIMNCQSVCRRETIQAFLDKDSQRKIDLEDAIWRVWTFCKLFGKGATPVLGFSKHVAWLNGTFNYKSNAKSRNVIGYKTAAGLSTSQLEDMSEMWRCMEHLLDGFHGQETSARNAGLFSRCIVTEDVTESDLLNTWIYDILSLGPKAVLTLVACDFEQAKVLGVTRWSPPTNSRGRDTFLRGAIEEVYRERLVADAQQKAATFKKTYSASHSHHRSVSDSAIQRPKIQKDAPPTPPKDLSIDTQLIGYRKSFQCASTLFEDPFEIRPDCDPLSAISRNARSPSPALITSPTSFSMLSMTPTASTRLGPSLFPDNEKMKPANLDLRPPPAVTITEPTVQDPSDKALELLIHGMGYPEVNARKALALSDSGSGINIQKAIELLSTNFRPVLNTLLPRSGIAELPTPTNEQGSANATFTKQEDFCQGGCKPIALLTVPNKERSQSMGLLKRGMSLTARMSMRKSTALSVIVDDEDDVVKTVDEEAQTKPSESLDNQDTFRSNGGGNRISILSTSTRDNRSPTTETFQRKSILGSDLLHRLTGLSSDAHLSSNIPAGFSNRSISPVSPLTAIDEVEHLTVEGRSSGESSHNSVGVTSNLSCMPASAMTMQKPRVTLMRVGTGRSVSVKSWRMGSRKEKTNTKANTTTGEVLGYAY